MYKQHSHPTSQMEKARLKEAMTCPKEDTQCTSILIPKPLALSAAQSHLLML